MVLISQPLSWCMLIELRARAGAGSPDLVRLPTEGEQMGESPRTPWV